MKTFVMGDIHGAYHALTQCLAACAFDYNTDTLIQLGDVVDGNAESYECIEYWQSYPVNELYCT